MASYRDYVRDDSGYQRPVEGAQLYLLNEGGSLATADDNPVRSDVNGFFEFTGVPDGVYTLDTRYAGVSLLKGSVIVGEPPDYKGDKGDPGGNLSAVGTLAQVSEIEVPDGVDQISVTGITTVGDGGAGLALVADPAVNASYVAANPETSALDANNRGFRATPVQGYHKPNIAPDAIALPAQAKLSHWITPHEFGALGEGPGHPLSMYIGAGKRFATLAAARAYFGQNYDGSEFTASTEIDHAAIRKTVALCIAHGRELYLPLRNYAAYIMWEASGIAIRGSGKNTTKLTVPAGSLRTVPNNNDGSGALTIGPPVGIDCGNIGKGNSAIAYSGGYIRDLTVDGNASQLATPENDLHGWGIALTKYSNVDLIDVRAQNTLAGCIGRFINSNGFTDRVFVKDGAQVAIEGDRKPNYDINSSKEGFFDVNSDGGYYAVRVLDNTGRIIGRWVAKNPAFTGLVTGNQTVNASATLNIEGVVLGGVRDYGTIVGANVTGATIHVQTEDIDGVPFIELGTTFVADQYRARNGRYVIQSARSGNGIISIGGNGATVEIHSTDDGQDILSGDEGDQFAVEVSGKNVTILKARIDNPIGKLRGLKIASGAQNVQYNASYAGAFNAVDDQSGDGRNRSVGTDFGFWVLVDGLGTPPRPALNPEFANASSEGAPVQFKKQTTDGKLQLVGRVQRVSGTTQTIFTIPNSNVAQDNIEIGQGANVLRLTNNGTGLDVKAVAGTGPWNLTGLEIPLA